MKKKVYKKRKTRVRFHFFKGLKCQGKKELRFLKECVRYNRPLPEKPKRIKTPYGYYTPDFSYPDKYIEVKSSGTFRVCLGLEAYKGIGEPSDLQWKKILYVGNHVKPIHIIIYVGRRERKPNYDYICEPGITIQVKGGYVPKRKKI